MAEASTEYDIIKVMSGLERLSKFLSSANRQTWAINKGKTPPSRLASDDFEYSEGDLLYHDTFFGDDKFIGEELVYKKALPVWGMNYFGRLTTTGVDTEEIYQFLRKAILNNNDLIPVRGPKAYEETHYQYKNHINGSLSHFKGTERIYRGGELVYEATYQGGVINDRELI